MSILNWRTLFTAAVASAVAIGFTAGAQARDDDRWDHKRHSNHYKHDRKDDRRHYDHGRHGHGYGHGHDRDHWRQSDRQRPVVYERQPVYVLPQPVYQRPMYREPMYQQPQDTGVNLNFTIPLR